MKAEVFVEAFARGRERWQRDWAPFAGIPEFPGVTQAVEFEFQTSVFRSYIAYERRVLDQLRGIQRVRHIHARETDLAAEELRVTYASVAEAADAMRESRWLRRVRLWRAVRTDGARALIAAEDESDRLARRGDALRELEELVTAELRAVREAVDWEHSQGRGSADVVAALRADPARPPGVVEYPDVASFVTEHRGRGVFDWPERQALGGADYGFNWRLENPTSRWCTTTWRVSWLYPALWSPSERGPREVYAVERIGEDREERVWLLARIPETVDPEPRLEQLQRHVQRERNSLVVVAREMQALATRAV